MARLRPPSTSNTTAPLPPPPPTIPADLPGLLVCLEQRHCVLRLSDARVAAVRLCLAAVASAAAEQMERVTESHPPPLPASVPHSSEIRRPRRSKQQIRTSSITLEVPALRRTIVVTFSMHELILQLDARGRPLAECRLASTAARFSRSTDPARSTTTYEVCLQVHSLTIADALCGLGGDFDLLAASHRNVRYDLMPFALPPSTLFCTSVTTQATCLIIFFNLRFHRIVSRTDWPSLRQIGECRVVLNFFGPVKAVVQVMLLKKSYKKYRLRWPIPYCSSAIGMDVEIQRDFGSLPFVISCCCFFQFSLTTP